MADNSTQIDELRLDITVEDKTSGESSDKKVRALATAISRLNSIVNKFDSAKMSNVFANMAKGIEPFVSKIKGVEKALNSLGEIAKKGGFKEISQATKNISIGKEQVETQSIEEGTLPSPSSSPTEQIKESAKEAESLSDKISKVTNKTQLLKLQLEMVQESLKKSGLSQKEIISLKKQELSLEKQLSGNKGPAGNLIKQFGRVAMYRAIRTVLKEITQAFTEGIGGLARYSSEVRGTMSNLTSSFAQVKASISVALYQPLMILEPVITTISQSIVGLSNGLSYLFAKIRGSNTYMRVNTEYWKEYQNAINGTLLSFDTFETLSANQNIDYSKMFEEVEVSASSFAKELGNAKGILDAIGIILGAFATYKIMSWIFDGGIKKLTQGLGGIKDKIQNISAAGAIASASFAFITSIINLIDVIKNWKSSSLVTQITAITAAVAALAAVILTIIAVVKKSAVLKAIGVGVGAVGTILAGVSAMKFADGGIMEGAGTMYAIAGEAGPEVVAQGSAGTGVLNVEQFSDAMVSALVRYGAARDNGGNGVIEIDGNRLGTYIAGNKGFRNEANRRNANLNWK